MIYPEVQETHREIDKFNVRKCRSEVRDETVVLRYLSIAIHLKIGEDNNDINNNNKQFI